MDSNVQLQQTPPQVFCPCISPRIKRLLYCIFVASILTIRGSSIFWCARSEIRRGSLHPRGSYRRRKYINEWKANNYCFGIYLCLLYDPLGYNNYCCPTEGYFEQLYRVTLWRSSPFELLRKVLNSIPVFKRINEEKTCDAVRTW